MHIDLIRTREKEFPTDLEFENITVLRIWHCKYKSLEAISKCTNLEVLIIATFPDQSFEFLSSLKRLKELSILHMPKLSDLDGIEALDKLEKLSLRTLPSWDSSGKKTIIDSLSPLTKLKKLSNLELLGVITPSKDLSSLLKCKELKTVRVGGYGKKQEKEFYATCGLADDFIRFTEV